MFTNKRVKKLEDQIEKLTKVLEDTKDLAGTYLITIREKDKEIANLKLKLENKDECIKKIEASNLEPRASTGI